MKRIVMLLAGLGALGAALPAAPQTVVKIAFAGPLTGPIAHVGKDEEYGTRLALDDANAKGVTIAGQKVRFELMSEDDQGDPRQATVVAQRIADAGVKGVVGHVTSGAAIPAASIYEQAGIPAITPSATSPKLTQQGFKAIFRVIANDNQQGEAMAKYTANVLKARTVAIIDDRTAYGQGLGDTLADNLKKLGVQVVAREYTTDKAVDFTALLTRIKSKQPDAIFYGGMDAQGAPMLKQIKQLGLNVKFLAGDGVCTSEMLKLAAPALGPQVYCTQAGLPVDKMPGGAEFKARFKQRFNAEVQLYAPYAYDATNALIEAMKLANSVEPAKYLPQLQKVSLKGVTGTVAFDAKGDNRNGGITLNQFGDGKWQVLN
ncbi:branched-chain amino acid ABC transporter substrate-binding protein [Azospira restricta]|uniref:Branched-chain amino acid ABC transporter substrate-binding protein n=1 Tax=Azospira restricta TaxID=404405 RepID=A0A974SRM8_9RHOO|nr:branched-chain amino acid ABC transporter substrate-binding protein [Azospira restricta]QRJ65169.1 branched-chain amino acid ABC transporter substrate-binding protein [Azospira restricta]